MGKISLAFPWRNHYCLQLRGYRMICAFLSMHRNQARLSTLSTARRQDRRAVITYAPGDYTNMPISPFMRRNWTRWTRISS